MIQQLLDLFRQEARSEWVRLRTLITLRWLAIAGQTGAVLAAVFFFDLKVHVGLCFFAIGASVVFNLMAGFVLPETKRLTERQTLLTLLFDVSQLAFLLYLTGGLNNPFALLILVPVTISASALTLGSTLIISAAAIVLITVLAFFYSWASGSGW
jgi:two-component system sensor histidine kinase RegB